VCEEAIKYSTPPLWNSRRPAVVQQARSCLQACQFSLFSFISSQSVLLPTVHYARTSA